MLQLDEPMTQAGMRHFITTFPGPHDWPPVAVMEEGFQWITLNAMRDGSLKRDDALISQIMSGFDQRVTAARQDNHLIAADKICREAYQFGNGLIGADQYKAQSEVIEQLPEYKKQLACLSAVMKKEAEEQSLFESSILSKDLPWWKNRVAKMERRNMKGRNPEDTLMNARLKAFLSLLCYSYANARLINHDYTEAVKIVAVYEVADPQNPEPNYMRAMVLASRLDNTAALTQLKVAVSKGFNDKNRMMQQSEFEPLKHSPAWFDLMK
jgi:hypothetical protein